MTLRYLANLDNIFSQKGDNRYESALAHYVTAYFALQAVHENFVLRLTYPPV